MRPRFSHERRRRRHRRAGAATRPGRRRGAAANVIRERGGTSPPGRGVTLEARRGGGAPYGHGLPPRPRRLSGSPWSPCSSSSPSRHPGSPRRRRPARRAGVHRASRAAFQPAAAPCRALPKARSVSRRCAPSSTSATSSTAGRLWRAAALFASPRVWPRRELRAVQRLEFRAARIDFAPDPNTLVVVARVRASGGASESGRHGETTLFFTLGRVSAPLGAG